MHPPPRLVDKLRTSQGSIGHPCHNGHQLPYLDLPLATLPTGKQIVGFVFQGLFLVGR
jgi:hypothetical protein